MTKKVLCALAAVLQGGLLAAGTPLLTEDGVWERVKADLLANPEALALLKADADRCLAMKPVSVTDKKTPPPSGDLHDYTSMAPYSWPNPKTADGLPYITRDGETNPEFYTYDNMRLEQLCAAVPTLILCGYATGEAKYMEKAGTLLRTWFIAPETRMNPNLRYAQFVRGVTDGRGIGIIDTNSLIFLLDAVTHLPESPSWSAEDLAGLKSWFSDYTKWLTTHPFGKDEEAKHNNHGSWFDAQVIAFSRFAGEPERIARQVNLTRKRIPTHIKADGSQPAELARTLSLTYSTYNLFAFACTAELVRGEGIDLWKEFPQLGKALDYLKPYYPAPESWPNPQIRPFAVQSAAPLFTLAAAGTGNPELEQYTKQFALPQHRILFSKAALSGRKSRPPETDTGVSEQKN